MGSLSYNKTTLITLRKWPEKVAKIYETFCRSESVKYNFTVVERLSIYDLNKFDIYRIEFHRVKPRIESIIDIKSPGPSLEKGHKWHKSSPEEMTFLSPLPLTLTSKTTKIW